MNFFEFYEIEPSFILDEASLKKKFYQKSREFHPDFFINESEEKQAEVLYQSTYNTNAYDALSNERKRIAYVLEMNGLSLLEQHLESLVLAML